MEEKTLKVTTDRTLASDKGSFAFHKDERLHHRTLVERLFRHGKNIYEFPFRMTWRVIDEKELSESFRDMVPENIGSLQMMVTVPKKKRKRAVDRVLLRRRIREAYRLNRLELKAAVRHNPQIRSLEMAFVYIHDKNLEYDKIEMKMRKLLKKLEESL